MITASCFDEVVSHYTEILLDTISHVLVEVRMVTVSLDFCVDSGLLEIVVGVNKALEFLVGDLVLRDSVRVQKSVHPVFISPGAAH